MQIKSALKKVALAASTLSLSIAAHAQSVAPSTPTELLQTQGATFVADTKVVLFAGAGLIIGALLVKKLVNLVISFFQRG